MEADFDDTLGFGQQCFLQVILNVIKYVFREISNIKEQAHTQKKIWEGGKHSRLEFYTGQNSQAQPGPKESIQF